MLATAAYGSSANLRIARLHARMCSVGCCALQGPYAHSRGKSSWYPACAGVISGCTPEYSAVQVVQAAVAAHDKDRDGRLSRAEFRNLLAASQQENANLSVKVA